MTSIDPSRHALKFKIKGPFLDANYSSGGGSTSTPSTAAFNTGSGVSHTASTPASADSSNLRRMRKKELIRQYVSQDVIPPSGTSGSGFSASSASSQSSSNPHLQSFLQFRYSSALAYANEEYLMAGSNDLSEVIGSTNVGTLAYSANASGQLGGSASGGMRSHISIPKAVASLAGVDSEWGALGLGNDPSALSSREGKRRRRGANNPPLSRELRNLQLAADPLLNPPNTAAAAASSGAVSLPAADTPVGRRKERRRGRPPGSGKAAAAAAEAAAANTATSEFSSSISQENSGIPPPPKLKIRLGGKGNGQGQVVTVCDPAASMKGDGSASGNQSTESSEGKRFRPPKKRLSDTGCGTDLTGGKGGTDSNPPTLEDLWRQSMKFREEVMADFSKSERRKGSSSSKLPAAMGNAESQAPDAFSSRTSSRSNEGSGSGLDTKPEFKNKRHKTKTRKDRSKSKDRDGNNRRRPPVASTDLVSIAGGGDSVAASGSEGCDASGLSVSVSVDCGIGRKRKRTSSGGSGVNEPASVVSIGDGVQRNGVQIIGGAALGAGSAENEAGSAPKLIIRFGKKAMTTSSGRTGESQNFNRTGGCRLSSEDVTPPPPLEKPSMARNELEDSSAAASVTTVRLMPIKLKLARGGSGGYVTSHQQQQQEQQQQAERQSQKSDSTPPPSPTPPPPTNNSTKESCQVR